MVQLPEGEDMFWDDGTMNKEPVMDIYAAKQISVVCSHLLLPAGALPTRCCSAVHFVALVCFSSLWALPRWKGLDQTGFHTFLLLCCQQASERPQRAAGMGRSLLRGRAVSVLWHLEGCRAL